MQRYVSDGIRAHRADIGALSVFDDADDDGHYFSFQHTLSLDHLSIMKRTRSGTARLVSTKSRANAAVTLFSLDDSTMPAADIAAPDLPDHHSGPSGTGNSSRRSKRKRVEVEEFQSGSDLYATRTERVSEAEVFKPDPTATPKPKSNTSSPKKRKAESTSPKKPKPVPRSLATPHPAPERWREVYDAIKDMRAGRTAAVDTMGCDQAQTAETDPKAGLVLQRFLERLSHTQFRISG